MPRMTLAYAKTILTKVSFDARLFEKELTKALRALPGQEPLQLRQWCYERFSPLYLPVLNRVFQVGPGC
ncbi:hypothetical protein [Pontibacter akesuensis]|uniref:Uncharacterized protein n=1 Tax=Pontibacter akesuensis TaxID=388950 RepID=A0A1I7KQL4_9BACT|nr:hypothetical protein [Pontibacter akesuensis]GHA81366.1 hypothetical protein GCM10007389_39880 [Pontibacter akesuensis]SFU99700.1 hypothetical protein SAMN04487941_3991 [Pontibacter akesuensis]